MLLLQANTTSLFSLSDLQLIAPELILTACACLALVMEVVLPYRKSKLTAYFALIGVALAMVSVGFQFYQLQDSTSVGFYGMIRIDGLALLFRVIFLIAAALAIEYLLASSTSKANSTGSITPWFCLRRSG